MQEQTTSNTFKSKPATISSTQKKRKYDHKREHFLNTFTTNGFLEYNYIFKSIE